MRIIVVGGFGTIGSAVVNELKGRHDILIAGRSRGDLIVDMRSEESIRSMFQKAGKFDAVVITAGNVLFEDLSQMNSQKYAVGLNDKLMGQVNCVLIGSQLIAHNGSFTLTSGILSQEPTHLSTSASMVNGAIDGFVRAAALELPNGIRINAVSPTLLVESLDLFGAFFRGYEPVPASKVALAYSKSVEGAQTGQVYRVGY
jgi:NAD(P)-dependent dehydrogenase (short-subunit alcohol dehydrogenase family)